MVVSCAHCGQFLGYGEIHSADRLRDALRSQVNPTKIEARLHALATELGAKTLDRKSWRTVALEYHALYAASHPEDLPESSWRGDLREWIEAAATHHELQVFEPELVHAMSKLSAAFAPLYSVSADPVEAARGVLAAAEQYMSALQSHPSYRALPTDPSPIDFARSQLELALRGGATLMGQEVLDRIFRGVLEYTPAELESGCESCGARLSREALLGRRCAYCGARQSVLSDDTFVKAMLALWGTCQHQYESRSQRAMGALSLGLSSMYGRGTLPAAHAMRRFLEASVPELARADLIEQLGVLRSAHGDRDGFEAWAGEVEGLLQEWPLDPDEHRRERAWERTRHRDPDDPEAWIEMRLGEWRLIAPTVEPSLHAVTIVSLCLQSFWLGASVQAPTAQRFIERAQPSLDRAALEAACDHWLSALSQPEILRFLDDLKG